MFSLDVNVIVFLNIHTLRLINQTIFFHVFGLKFRHAMSSEQWEVSLGLQTCFVLFSCMVPQGAQPSGDWWNGPREWSARFVAYHQHKWCKQFKYFGTSIHICHFKSQKLVIEFLYFSLISCNCRHFLVITLYFAFPHPTKPRCMDCVLAVKQ